jgi:hypothetical protein
MKKKVLKILALVLALVLIIGIGVFANALVGNPVSKSLATKSANEYIKTTYSDKDFVIEEVNYDFKTGGYYARVTSPTSIDSHFSLSFNWLGKLVLDCYDDVTTGWNTAMRLEDDYRNAVKAVTESKDFSEKYFIAYGEIPCVLSDYPIDEEKPEYALQRKDLVLDKVYDIREVGANHGKLVLYAYDDDVTTGWNTAMRLEDDYRNAVKAVTESKDFSEKYFIAYGEIPCVLSDYPIDEEHPEYAL